MSTLRIVLLIFGILLVAGIYFIGRRKESEKVLRREPALGEKNEQVTGFVREPDLATPLAFEEPPATQKLSPELTVSSPEFDAFPNDNDVKFEFDTIKSKAVQNEDSVEGRLTPLLHDEELVIINLFAQESSCFEGSNLYRVLESHGFSKGDRNIFYYTDNNARFSVVNVFKPGFFPDIPDNFSTKGIGIVLQLHDVKQPLSAFEQMIAVSDKLAKSLNGRLHDAQRSSLTQQTITYLHEHVQQYQNKHCV